MRRERLVPEPKMNEGHRKCTHQMPHLAHSSSFVAMTSCSRLATAAAQPGFVHTTESMKRLESFGRNWIVVLNLWVCKHPKES